MKTLVRSALSVAATQLGVRETGSSNSGPKVDQYIRRTGLRPPASWCACYIYWCIDEASVEVDYPNPFLRSGYCPSIQTWARGEDIYFTSPEPGDVFLILHDNGRAHHTGFVEEVLPGGGLHTMEGNTNEGGSSNGYGVFRRMRQVGPHISFVRWANLVEEEAALAGWALSIAGKPVGDLILRNNRTFAPVRKWARALGLRVDWDFQSQAVTLGGKMLDSQVFLVGGEAFASLRDLAEAAGLQLTIDATGRGITAHR